MIKKKQHPSRNFAFILLVDGKLVGEVCATYTSKNKRHWDAYATYQGTKHTVARSFSAKRAIDELNSMFDFISKSATSRTTAPRAIPKHQTPAKVDMSGLPELRNKCNALLVECYNKSKLLFPSMTIFLPSIDFNKRGLTAGTANYAKNHISINPIYLVEQATNGFIEETIPHELAHLIAYNVYGMAGHGHGRKWQHVMRQLGYTPTRCHNYDGTNARVRQTVKYEVACACHREEPMFIGAVRAARMRKETRTYTCNRCHTRVKLV